jgi:5-methyltetrahydrofolate--homocysteine methyltransferase
MKKTECLSGVTGELATLYRAVVQGEEETVREAVRKTLAAGVPATRILSDALIPAMTEVGRLFEIHEYYLPELMISSDAMHAGLDILRPLFGEATAHSFGRIALGTVEGDLHDIGKNLVIMMLEGSGFHVTDLGLDIPSHRFVQAVKEGAQLIGMSAMLPTTMPNMKLVIDAIRAEGLRERVKVIVGGPLLTQEYADRIGADGYASDASSAVRKVKELLLEIPRVERKSEIADPKVALRFPETQTYF